MVKILANLMVAISTNAAAVPVDEYIYGDAVRSYVPLPTPCRSHTSLAKFRWMFGGNRSSKTHSNMMDCAMYALGVHPTRVTPDNCVIWVATVNWEMVGEILWGEKLSEMIPAHLITHINWHNKSAGVPGSIKLFNGTRIIFKAFEQGRKAFQGKSINAFYGDEQIPVSGGEDVWQEIQARLIDRQGFSSWSMTPLIYQQWLEDRIAADYDTDWIGYANLNDNRISRGGYIHDSEIDDLINQWPEEVQDTRIKGFFASFQGVVYKSFRKDLHVVKPFSIPDDWDKWRVLDWGFNNPFACIWITRDHDGNYYVYREHYKAQQFLSWHANQIKTRSKGETYRCTWADHDAQDRYEFKGMGIPTVPARKDVRRGIETVQAMLKLQPNNKPRLQVFADCKNVIREFSSYRWDDSKNPDERDAKDEPKKVNDHSMDAIRYAIFALEGENYFTKGKAAA